MQPQNPSLGNAQIVLNTHVEATFQIPDVTKVLAVPDLLKVYMQPAVAAIAQSIESDLLNLYAGFTANTPVGTAGTPHHRSGGGRGGNRAVPGEGSAARAEVHGGGRRHLFGVAADSALQRVSELRRSGLARDCRRHDRQGEGLLRVPLAVRAEDRKQSR